MMGASFRANLASIRGETTELRACRKSADRQTDRQTAFHLYIVENMSIYYYQLASAKSRQNGNVKYLGCPLLLCYFEIKAALISVILILVSGIFQHNKCKCNIYALFCMGGSKGN